MATPNYPGPHSHQTLNSHAPLYPCLPIAIFVMIFVFLLLFQNVAAADVQRTNCESKEYRQQIQSLWKNLSPVFLKWADGNGYISDGFQRQHPYELYDIQLHTTNLLRYAVTCNDEKIFDSLLMLYGKVFQTAAKRDNYVFFYLPGRPRTSTHKLSRKHYMWLNGRGQESILCSSQFLYVVSEALLAIATMKPEQRSHKMIDFAANAFPILVDHYERWCFGEPGPFQVRGWGCKVSGKYAPSGLNHFEFIGKKLECGLGDEKSPSYCNAVTDTDMWIITGVANVLAASKLAPHLVKLSKEQEARYMNYLDRAMALIQDRFKIVPVKNFEGHIVYGAIFDPGAWDDHAGHKFRGYTGRDFPSTDVVNSKHKLASTSWDISHSRRYVDVFISLVRDARVIGFSFPKQYHLKYLANQFVYKVFNGDFKRPLFSNFWSGANGWYRVNYNKQTGYGYAPGDLSIAALTGGYAWLAQYNKDLSRLYSRLCQMVLNGSKSDIKWLQEHFSGNRYKNYKCFRLSIFDGKSTLPEDMLLLDFLPALSAVQLPFVKDDFIKCNVDNLTE